MQFMKVHTVSFKGNKTTINSQGDNQGQMQCGHNLRFTMSTEHMSTLQSHIWRGQYSKITYSPEVKSHIKC